jgi:hypothetical protein
MGNEHINSLKLTGFIIAIIIMTIIIISGCWKCYMIRKIYEEPIKSDNNRYLDNNNKEEEDDATIVDIDIYKNTILY